MFLFWSEIGLKMLEEKGMKNNKTMKRIAKRGPTHFLINGRQRKYLVGDAGVEPTAFGSGDQRSIQLS